MKTTISLKKTIQVILVMTIMISSVIITKRIISNIKHEYSMLPAGSGKACFYEMMR